MIVQTLGPELDINCGGIDNLYRHHDYNIAILESYSGSTFANYYLHGEHLVVNGAKMSKSKGNIVYPEHIIEKGYKPYHLRYFLIQEHYRKRLNYTEERFRKKAREVDELRQRIARLIGGKGPKESPGTEKMISDIRRAFEERMNDDLRAGEAIEAVGSLIKRLDDAAEEGLAQREKRKLTEALRSIDEVLGVLLP
jgi:cysteinyl-tRNA synthetase